MSTPQDSTSPESFEIPNPFGRYQLLRKLGQGGMGSVYLAVDTVLKRRVALKVPRELAGRQPGLVARFRREAEVLAGFQHPNICRVLDVGEIEGLHYLTMEYHEGKPLDAVLVRGKAMKAEQAARIVRKLALALQKAHDGGIVHRDLKPSNVLLTAEKDLVILDFGLARSVETDSHRLSVTGEILGTPAYMSPEQVKADPSAIGPATDVYSLGVMLYEMLCGRRPFSGPVTTILSNILNDRPHPPSTYHPRLDLSLEAVCMKALEKDPASRYTTMAEFAEALSDWLSVRTGSDTFTGVSLIRDGPQDPGTSSGAGASRGFPKGLAAAAAGFLAVLLAVVLYVGTRDGTVRIVSGGPKQRPERTTPTREEARPASGPTTASGETPGSPQPLAPGPKEVVDPPVPADVGSPAVANPTVLAGDPRPGEERDDNALMMKFCWCPPGTFVMGSPPGEPGHEKDEGPVRVTLTRGFWLGKYEVTQSQWKQVRRTTLADQKAKGASGEVVGEGPDHPMYFVSHSEAEAFCRTLTESERAADRLPAGWEYRLPTEAQWEYACRAGTTTATAFGDALGSAQANFDGKGHPYNGAETGPYLGGTVPVGRYPANRWGLHDMHGNVWEWCRDGYLENLPGGVDPSGPTGLPTCVIRGGCWNDGGAGCRSAFRFGGAPESRNNGPGFRVALIQR